MGNIYPRPTGQLEGDTQPMPDRGISTGVTDTYGADLEQGYNGLGSIADVAQSDHHDQNHSKNKRVEK